MRWLWEENSKGEVTLIDLREIQDRIDALAEHLGIKFKRADIKDDLQPYVSYTSKLIVVKKGKKKK